MRAHRSAGCRGPVSLRLRTLAISHRRSSPSGQALDADLFSNITFRIKTGSARLLFALDPISGNLSMLQTLDFEDLAALGMGTSYTFQVEAVDQAGVMPPGQATVTVRITVRDTHRHTHTRTHARTHTHARTRAHAHTLT